MRSPYIPDSTYFRGTIFPYSLLRTSSVRIHASIPMSLVNAEHSQHSCISHFNCPVLMLGTPVVPFSPFILGLLVKAEQEEKGNPDH